jgi:hypothetical protein
LEPALTGLEAGVYIRLTNDGGDAAGERDGLSLVRELVSDLESRFCDTRLILA